MSLSNRTIDEAGDKMSDGMKKIRPVPLKANCPLCKSARTRLIISIASKPGRETDFGISDYRRLVFFCDDCKVYFNKHGFDLSKLYSGDYNKATYDNKIRERYDKIMGLPESQSDNKQRVNRIVSFLRQKGFSFSKTKVLDIGSGLCVFLGELKKHGLLTYCLDPDALSVKHARDYVKVDSAWQESIEDFTTKEKFDLVTFNKVLEHVNDPIHMLAKSRSFLKKGGIVYIELPDAKAAEESRDFTNREEFFIEHNYVFTKASTHFIIKRAGFFALELESITDPSGKSTIYAFLASKDEDD